MKQLRLVFRGHLLPPIVLPFHNIVQYTKLTHPNEYEQVKLMSGDARKEKLQRYQPEMLQVNELLMKQVGGFRDKYVEPLKKCPSYFELLDRQVRTNLTSLIKGQYIHNLNKIPSKIRFNCFKSYKKMYSEYKTEMEKSNMKILSEVHRIPIFWYSSAADLAQLDNKNWQGLNSKQKNDYELAYLKLLEKYDVQIQKLSLQTTLSKVELFEAFGNPLQYYQDASLRKTLLS